MQTTKYPKIMRMPFIYILFFTLISMPMYSQENYEPYDESINSALFLPSGVSGGGTITVNINYNTLTLAGSIGFNSASNLKTGQITQINTPYTLPYLDLGFLSNTAYGGIQTSYQIEIINNEIVISSTQNETFNYVSFNISVDLTPNDLNDNEPNKAIPDLGENYVYVLEANRPINGTLSITRNTTTNEYTLKEGVTQSISYLDGLGRPIQSIGIGSSPLGKDIISHMEYDEIGRMKQEFLPYASSSQDNGEYLDFLTVKNEQENYYLANYSDDLGGAINPYSEKLFDGSPLNRTIKQGAPGSDWMVNLGTPDDHTIKYNYDFNTYDLSSSMADNVRRFYVSHPGNTENTKLEPNGYYKANELFKFIVKDENWSSNQIYLDDNTIHEFKNKLGQIVLKRTFDENERHDTYYIYDNFGNLTYVLPPKASDVIVSETEGNDSGISWQGINSWVDLVQVDSEFADEYNKKLEEYGDKDVREADIENKYGGQGGFSLIAYKDGTFSVDIDFTVVDNVELKQGVIASFDKKFNIKDIEIGAYDGDDFSYKFFIKNNDFVIEGSGNILGLNQEYFTTNNNLIVEIDEEVLDGLCYIYHYDKRNRLIEKKIAGKGWEHIVYNKIDQPILTQDKLQREDNKWLFTKYDVFGRVVYTGEYSYSPSGTDENSGRLEIQSIINNETNSINYETKLSSATTLVDNLNIEYTNDSFPTQNLTLFTVNFYDNYNFDFSSEINFTGSFNQTPFINATSLSTGSKVRVLETDDWITAVSFYNDKGSLIFVASENEFLDSRDIIKSKVDFVGKILETETTHHKGSDAPIVTMDYYGYDHMNRLISHTQKINNQDEELITLNSYDELGQLKNKKVGGAVATTVENSNGLQQVDYDYNIRGWLKSINDGLLNNGDLFGFSINYNTKTEPTTTELFNGNISETHWITANDNQARKYCYSYDGLNRLVNAEYHGGTLNFPYNVPGETTKNEQFHLRNIDYDKNGNILALERYGVRQGHSIGTNSNFTTDIVDGLTYSYIPNTNTLQNVSDFADNNEQNGYEIDSGKFLERYQGEKYDYDLNGNLIKDLNKDIVNIEYNHLNLPSEITIIKNWSSYTTTNTIAYVYDAIGTKIKKTVTEDIGSYILNQETLYAGNYIYHKYEGGMPVQGAPEPTFQLKMFSQPEGYIEPTDNGDYIYAYQYKDHLGNIRLVYSDIDDSGGVDASEILEENNYYPFGATHGWYNNYIMDNTIARKFKYNGKELNDELGLNWYDFGARNYDASLGRWMNLDPLAEKYYDYSTYSYVKNSPTTLVDPDGMDVILFIWLTEGGDYGHAGVAVSNYKKDAEGNYTKDEDGNYIEDGTYTYYDLYPDEAITRLNVLGSQGADFESGSIIQGNIRTVDDLQNYVQSDAQKDMADGILLTETTFETDQIVKSRLEQRMNDDKDYESTTFNCSDFCREAYEGILQSENEFGSQLNYVNFLPTMFAKESESYAGKTYNFTTPHQLFKDVKNFKTTYVIKDPGEAVNKSFKEAMNNQIGEGSKKARYKGDD